MSDYKKYYSWQTEIKGLFKLIPKVILGAFVFSSLVRKKEDTYYVVLPTNIGDSILALSYLAEFKHQKGIHHVTAICMPNYVQRICKYYPNTVDAVICKEKWKLAALRGFVSTSIGQHLSALYLDQVTFVFLTCNVSMRTLWDNPVITFPVYAKAILYKIDIASQPEAPQIPETDISLLVEKYDLEKGRTVFLNPTANSVRCDVSELLTKVVNNLTSHGYTVITLTVNEKESPVYDTRAIPCSLEEAYHLIAYGGILIGLRSGFLDLMVFTGAKIISVVDEGYGLKDFCDLEKLGVNSDCHTVIYNGDDEAAVRQIMNAIEKG